MIRWAVGRPAVIWATAVALLGACSRPALLPVPAGAVEWRPFYWAQVDAGDWAVPRAAILIEPPPRFEGPAGRLLQLDLAGSGALPDGFPIPGAAGDRGSTAEAGEHLAGVLRALAPVRGEGAAGAWRAGAPVSEIGTAGLPAFALGLLVLDLGSQRIGTAPVNALPPTFWDQVPIVAIRNWNDRVVLPVTGAAGSFDALFDTGLIPFPLWTSCARFEDLVGQRAAGAVNREVDHPRGTLRFAVGQTRDPVRIAQVNLGRLEVACLVDGPPGASVEGWGWPTEAVLGITAFQDAGVVILDVRRKRLAVVPANRWPR